MKVAALQMVSGPDVAANLAAARRLLEDASRRGAELAALPEYFCLMGMHDSDKLALAEVEGEGPIQAMLASAARDLGLWIIGGTLPIQSTTAERVRNSTLVFSPDGERVARYDKIHLFAFDNGRESYDEGRVLEPGSQPTRFDAGGVQVGLSVCYDLRFPELYRAMKAVDIILVPSAFTETTGKAHWEALIRARAIENLAYVLAPAQGGYHVSGRETHGDSMIVDPWGVVLDRLPRGSGVVVAGINLQHLRNLRESLPALTHRTLHRC